MLMILLSMDDKQQQLPSEINSLYETLWTEAGSDLLILMMEKLNWSNDSSATDPKMDGSVLEEKSSSRMLGLSSSSKLDWGSYILSISKTASKRIGTLNACIKFLSPRGMIYLYRPTIRPCMEYCCPV